MLRNVALLFLLIAAVAAPGCGPGTGSTPPTSGSSKLAPKAPPTKEQPPPSQEPGSAAQSIEPPVSLILQSKDFDREYQADRNQASCKYEGKEVEVTGVLRDVGIDSRGYYITLGDPNDERLDVHCGFGRINPLTSALPGQTVCVRGRAWLLGASLLLKNCKVVSASGPTPPVLEATQLAKKCQENRAEINKKYSKKYIIVAGQIVAISHDGPHTILWLTQKDATPAIQCLLDNEYELEQARDKALAVGQNVRILGYMHESDLTFNLGFCSLAPTSP